MNTKKENNMDNRKHPRYSRLSLKDLPETTRQQLINLVDERSYRTVKAAIIVALRDLYRKEAKGEEDGTDS